VVLVERLVHLLLQVPQDLMVLVVAVAVNRLVLLQVATAVMVEMAQNIR
jgi:hypothetical protein